MNPVLKPKFKSVAIFTILILLTISVGFLGSSFQRYAFLVSTSKEVADTCIEVSSHEYEKILSDFKWSVKYGKMETIEVLNDNLKISYIKINVKRMTIIALMDEEECLIIPKSYLDYLAIKRKTNSKSKELLDAKVVTLNEKKEND